MRAAVEWVFAHPPDPARVQALAHTHGLPELAAHVLAVRTPGWDDAAVDAFLSAELDRLDDPAGVGGMDDALATLVPAIVDGRPLLVFGDYDVDGTAGAALLTQVLRACGATVTAVVPNREDGYGLSVAAVRAARHAGIAAIITVDNGIAAHDAAREAERLGLTLVVTDHHHVDAAHVPPAAARVHPQLGGDPRGWRHASGAGVALALAIALRRALRQRGWFGAARPEPPLHDALALAALGTVADMVPLWGANRVVVREGLRRIRERPPLPLRVLLDAAGTRAETLDEEGIAFRVAPRLNAAGRMGDARRALDLLMCEREDHAVAMARELERENRRRQGLERDIARQVEAVLHADPQAQARPLIYAAHPEWRHGVLGIVAGQFARRWHRPTILFQIQGDVARASARSIPEVDLMAALGPVHDLALSIGGHREAAGLTLPVAALGEARTRVESGLRTLGGPLAWRPTLHIDAVLPVDRVDGALLESLRRLQPFGSANPRPLFASDGFHAVSPRLFKGEHLGFSVPSRSGPLRAIGFRMRDRYPLPLGRIRIAFRPQPDEHVGAGAIALVIEDLRAEAL